MKYITAHCVSGYRTCCVWNDNLHSEDLCHLGCDDLLLGECSCRSFRNQVTEQQSVIIPEDMNPQETLQGPQIFQHALPFKTFLDHCPI